ncbi:MAG TPA: SAM-dependent methyltransferase [Negativicutes bacterium]|nr:SAM-dependent methyltransferase [Negativicutes bacterium]
MNNTTFIVTASAQYLNQALSELQEADTGARAVKLLENGIAIIETKQDKKGFIAAVKEKRPVFIRHMNHVDFIIDSPGYGPEDIAERVKGCRGPEQGKRIAVQVRKGSGEQPYEPIAVKNAVDKVLEDMGAVPEVKEPEMIVSVLLCEDKCYMGLGDPQENLSGWSGGMMHFRKSEDDISRAKFKLMEAIKTFDMDMSAFNNALDLGAAPGGWTSVLLEHGLQVTAVDTGDMDERLFKHPGLRFIKSNASDLKLEPGSFDLLTSDMSWNPKNTARIIINASEYLKAGGTAVVTLKLMGEKVRKTVREVISLYNEVFEVLEVKQLFHNRDEVTLYLRKR